MRVPDEAIFRNDDASTVVLQRARQGERSILRRIRVRADEPDPQTGDVTIEDPTDRLAVADRVHRAERPESLLVDLYGKLGAFHDDLERAPKTLQDVRTLLYWAAVMLDAPLCQGEVKARAAAAFTQAKTYYDTARRQLLEGRSVDAVRRLREALRRISSAAAEIEAAAKKLDAERLKQQDAAINAVVEKELAKLPADMREKAARVDAVKKLLSEEDDPLVRSVLIEHVEPLAPLAHQEHLPHLHQKFQPAEGLAHVGARRRPERLGGFRLPTQRRRLARRTKLGPR